MFIQLIASETLSSASFTLCAISSGGFIFERGLRRSSQGSKEVGSEAPISNHSLYSYC